MLSTLRSRLTLSHTLPVLILVPMLGLLLLYQIERSYFWGDLATELTVQGELIAELITPNWSLWQDESAALRVWQSVHVSTPTSLMLLDADANLLSATAPRQQALAELEPDLPIVAQVIRVGDSLSPEPTRPTGTDGLTVFVPIHDDAGHVMGVVRLSHPIADIQQQLWLLRWTILTTLMVGGLLSLTLGLLLARSLSLPLTDLTNAVARFRLGEQPQFVTEVGAAEIRSLAHTYNVMGQRLFEVETSRRRLLAGMVHELARPLGGIKAAAQTIQRSEDRAINVEMATGINQTVDQLQFQLEDIALIPQIEMQALKLNMAAVDLPALVEEQCDKFYFQAEQKGLQLRLHGASQSITVQGDAQRLSQIVGNLIHNSIKYTPDGGCIDIKTFVQAGDAPATAFVEVKDSGPGIEVEEQEAIFGFFYRSPRQRIHQGLGIGLALSRWLAEAHGGSLSVQSQPYAGATFTLALPLHSS